MKHPKLIAIFFAILISSMTCGFSNAPKSRGPESTIFFLNHPKTSGEWIFYGGKSIYVVIENLSNINVYATLHCHSVQSLQLEYFIMPHCMTSGTPYNSLMSYPVQWAFTVGVTSSGKITATATWNR